MSFGGQWEEERAMEETGWFNKLLIIHSTNPTASGVLKDSFCWKNMEKIPCHHHVLNNTKG